MSNALHEKLPPDGSMFAEEGRPGSSVHYLVLPGTEGAASALAGCGFSIMFLYLTTAFAIACDIWL
jgi:hypothetical protein